MRGMRSLASSASLATAGSDSKATDDSARSVRVAAWLFVCCALVFAMVVVGGTTLTGGRGGVGLTLLGVLTIGYLDKILSINAVSEAGRLMLTGAIIVVAVLAQGRRRG